MRALIFATLFIPSFAFGLRFVQTSILQGTAMAVGELDSAGLDVSQMNNISVQAKWIGTPMGTLKLQVSDDIVAPCPAPNVACGVVNWSDYSGSQTAVNGAGNFLWNITLGGYRWIRMVYIGAASSGTLTMTNLVGKGY